MVASFCQSVELSLEGLQRVQCWIGHVGVSLLEILSGDCRPAGRASTTPPAGAEGGGNCAAGTMLP